MPAIKKRKTKAMEAKNKQTTSSRPNKKRNPWDIVIEKAHSSGPVEAKGVKEDPENGCHDPEDKSPSVETSNADGTKDQSEYIENLETANDLLVKHTRTLMRDHNLMIGSYADWPEVELVFWSKRLKQLSYSCSNWTYFHGMRFEDGKYDSLSKTQKTQLIASMRGYVVQEDFDTIVSRVAPHIRPLLPGLFASIIIMKDLLDLFFKNPFWYLEWPDGYGSSELEESGTTTHCGSQLNGLYQTFLGVNPYLANHWRAQMIRLCNAKVFCQSSDPTFALKNQAFREAKIRQLASDKFADETFQLLLKDPNDAKQPRNRELTLRGIYRVAAELAVGIATAQPGMEWQTLEDISGTFRRPSEKVEAIDEHQLRKRDPSLNGNPILALITPVFCKTNDLATSSKDNVIVKGNALVGLKKPIKIKKTRDNNEADGPKPSKDKTKKETENENS